MYEPTQNPEFSLALAEEFRKIAESMHDIHERRLPTLRAAPERPRAGMLAVADGTNWDPMGATSTDPYLVVYTGTAWKYVDER